MADLNKIFKVINKDPELQFYEIRIRKLPWPRHKILPKGHFFEVTFVGDFGTDFCGEGRNPEEALEDAIDTYKVETAFAKEKQA
jgi:hypothetical protein